MPCAFGVYVIKPNESFLMKNQAVNWQGLHHLLFNVKIKIKKQFNRLFLLLIIIDFFINKKFEFELQSKVYLVASLLNVENLNEWKERSYGNPYYLKAFESNMFDILKMFENKKSPAPAIVPVKNNKNNENHSNNISRHYGLINLARLLRSKSSEQIEDSFDKAIMDEIRLFTSLINEIEIRSTNIFW